MSVRISVLVFVAGCVSWPSAHALAQQSPASEERKWEIDVHAGGVRVGKPGDATTAMPAAGEPFTTANGRPSRYVSSWYFGDGAALRNQNAAAFTPTPINARIVPLDSVLTGVAARPSSGGSYGLRVGRRLSSRVTAEFNADYGPFRLEWLDSALTEFEASRASFANVWNGDFGTGAFLNPVVTSLSEIDEGGGGQVATTGTVEGDTEVTRAVGPVRHRRPGRRVQPRSRTERDAEGKLLGRLCLPGPGRDIGSIR